MRTVSAPRLFVNVRVLLNLNLMLLCLSQTFRAASIFLLSTRKIALSALLQSTNKKAFCPAKVVRYYLVQLKVKILDLQTFDI